MTDEFSGWAYPTDAARLFTALLMVEPVEGVRLAQGFGERLRAGIEVRSGRTLGQLRREATAFRLGMLTGADPITVGGGDGEAYMGSYGLTPAGVAIIRSISGATPP